MQSSLQSTSGFYYLASPYSHRLRLVRLHRMREAMRCQAWMKNNGIITYSPIIHWHFVAEDYKLPLDAASWKRDNDVMIGASCGVMVLAIEGWQESLGVRDEIKVAREMGKALHWVKPTGSGEYTIDAD